MESIFIIPWHTKNNCRQTFPAWNKQSPSLNCRSSKAAAISAPSSGGKLRRSRGYSIYCVYMLPWLNKDTANHPEFNDPFISYRVAKGADKGDRDHQVRKGQPVISVRQERVVVIGFPQGPIYF